MNRSEFVQHLNHNDCEEIREDRSRAIWRNMITASARRFHGTPRPRTCSRRRICKDLGIPLRGLVSQV